MRVIHTLSIRTLFHETRAELLTCAAAISLNTAWRTFIPSELVFDTSLQSVSE